MLFILLLLCLFASVYYCIFVAYSAVRLLNHDCEAKLTESVADSSALLSGVTFNARSTYYRSSWRQSSQPISWLVQNTLAAFSTNHLTDIDKTKYKIKDSMKSKQQEN